MENYKRYRDECLDHIINNEEDTKTTVKKYYFLMNQLKECKEPLTWDLMRSKVELILRELEPSNLVTIVPEKKQIIYPPYQIYQLVYEVYDHAIKELPRLIRPERLIKDDKLSEDQLKALKQLEDVTTNFQQSRN